MIEILMVMNDDAGDWQGLDRQKQNPRYLTIADMIKDISAVSGILDVGCGEALSRSYLPGSFNCKGIEQSSKAAELAREKNKSDRIINATADDFCPDNERFDINVFNEMLYYTADPAGLLSKYVDLLKDGGVILCFIYQKHCWIF